MAFEVEHHVYFWLKEEKQNEVSREEFEKGIEALFTSPTVAEAVWGRPAKTAERPVTDNSWDYAIAVKFETMAQHDAYQGDDVEHTAFVEGFKDWWEKVEVRDLAPV